MFYVYVLQSDSDSGLYIAFTTDLKKAFRATPPRHSFATSYRGPWKLIYYEAYLNREDAEGRERYLKSGSGGRFFACADETSLRTISAPTDRVRPKPLTRITVQGARYPEKLEQMTRR